MPESLEQSLARIFSSDSFGVGAGVLIDKNRLITCAHVIASALSMHEIPDEKPEGLITIDFPLVAPKSMCQAKIISWQKPNDDDSGDVAVLELVTPPPPSGTLSANFKSSSDLWDHKFRVLGFPDETGVYAHGRICARLPSGWVQIEASEHPIEPGFSGSPVWDEELGGIVGIVVATKRRADAKVAYMIPTEAIERVAPGVSGVKVGPNGDTDKASLTESEWDTLLTMISMKRCTPFLGAGACIPTIPPGSSIARTWAEEHGYPLRDTDNLSRVAQYIAVNSNHIIPKENLLRRWVGNNVMPDFNETDEPHVALASLMLPIYMTTNYDNFMHEALLRRGVASKQMVCRWNRYVADEEPEESFTPSSDNPLVFHLHGYKKLPESLVLTEDDYLDFVVNLSRNETLLPHYIRRALRSTSLLFIGYSINDITFRVIFRSIIGSLEASLGKSHVAVQLVPVDDDCSAEQRNKAREYLQKYFQDSKISIYWGTAREFAAELIERWARFQSNG